MIEQVAALRGEVKAMQLALRENYERTGDGMALLHTRSNQVDQVLVRLWKSLRKRFHSTEAFGQRHLLRWGSEGGNPSIDGLFFRQCQRVHSSFFFG